MSRTVVRSDENSRRARSNTSAANSFARPSEQRGLTRSKSAGAIAKSALSYRDWVAVPAGREVFTRTRSGSTGNQWSEPSPPLPPVNMKDVEHLREVREGPRIERAKTSAGVGGLGTAPRELSTGGTGGTGSSGSSGSSSGGGDSHASTFTSIAAKVRPKLASLTSLRRGKSHHISKSASATPNMNTPVPLPFIFETPEESTPLPPPPSARLVPREPVIRRSRSLHDVKVNTFQPVLSTSSTLPDLPLPKSARGLCKREVIPSGRSISRPPIENHNEDLGARPDSHALPIRTSNRHITVYAPAPSVPPSSSSPRPAKHLVKPSLSLTLPNGVSIVHEPLLLSPIPPSTRSTRSTTFPLTPPPSRPPPRAHLPESPCDFNFGFDTKPEAWRAPVFPSPPPSATFSIASYYYNTSTEADADFRDAITRYIELGDMESVRSLELCNNGGWAAPTSQLQVHLQASHAGPGGSLNSPAQLLPLDRRSLLPTPEPIGNGKFPPLPPPPKHNKKLPTTPTTRDEADKYADGPTRPLRLRRSPSYRSHLTPVTPNTPPLLTPRSNMALPTLAPWRAEEMSYSPNQEVSIVAKQPSLKIRNKRTSCRPATGF